MPIKKKSKSFLVEGSLLSALEKNRIEAKNLKTYCEKLTRQLSDNCFEIERRNYDNYRFLSEVKHERINNASKLTLVNDNLVREPIYFDLMNNLIRVKSYDEENELAHALSKSLREQQTRSAKTIRDMLDYNGKKPLVVESAKPIIVNKNDELRTKHNVSLNENLNATKRKLQLSQRCLSGNPRLYGYNVLSAISFKSMNTLKSEDHNIATSPLFCTSAASNFKSIRRERQSAKQLNLERDKKIEFLQNSKKYSFLKSFCSRRCAFVV